MPNFSQGPVICGTGTSSFSADAAWANPSNLTLDDGSFAQSNPLPSSDTAPLAGTNFGFTLPSAANVTGILFTLKKFGQRFASAFISDDGVFAIKAAGGTGNDLSIPGNWPLNPTQFTYGGMTDTLGLGWFGSDINDPGFGLSLVALNNSDTATLSAFVAALYATVFFQVNAGTGSNGGVTAFERIALYPMSNGNIYAFDPLSGFDDPTDSGTYFWRVEEISVGRKPTVDRLFVTYRDLGVVTIRFTLTATQDDQTVVSNFVDVTLGNSSPTGFLLTKQVFLPVTSGMNMQLSMSRAAGAGPIALAKLKICGRVETDSNT